MTENGQCNEPLTSNQKEQNIYIVYFEHQRHRQKSKMVETETDFAFAWRILIFGEIKHMQRGQNVLSVLMRRIKRNENSKKGLYWMSKEYLAYCVWWLRRQMDYEYFAIGADASIFSRRHRASFQYKSAEWKTT